MNEINGVLLKALEQLAGVLGERSTPEDIRHNYEVIDLMVEVNQAAHNTDASLIEELEQHAPTFVQLYSEVMLRNIREPINNGIEED